MRTSTGTKKGDHMDIRTAALKKCYAMEGYADLPLEEKNRIYDATVKEITEGEKKCTPIT